MEPQNIDTKNALYAEYIKLSANAKNHFSVKELVSKHLFKNEVTPLIYSDLIDCLKEFMNNTKSFQLVLNAFCYEIKHRKIEILIEEPVKSKALNLVKSLKNHLHYLKLQLIKVFNINYVDELTMLIEYWKTKGYYSSACSLVMHLNIHSVEYLKSLVVHLIPQCMDNAYKFVNDDRQLQIELLHHLDMLYKQNSSCYHNLISKFRRKYDLPLDECPEYHIGACKHNLNFLNSMVKKNQISLEAWKEMVLLRTMDDPLLQSYFINNLEDWNLTPLALEMMKLFSVPSNFGYEIDISTWPTLLGDQSYLQLEETVNPIVFIDNSETFKTFLEKVSKEDVFGFDCEWRPELIEDAPLSILQVATKREIFILDMIQLNRCLQEKDFLEVLNGIFFKKECLKLGYAIDTDVQKLLEYFPTESHVDMKNVLDLKNLNDFLKNSIPNFVGNERHSFKGLAQLSFEVLGNELDKGEQCSDWEKRPLRENQIKYAALDAFCLIKIYEELKNKVNKLPDYDFEELIASFDAGNFIKVLSIVEDTPSPDDVNSIPNDNHPICITQIKFLADKMLFGLGRHLRILGADCAIIENETQEEALQLYGTDRIILSTGQSYKIFQKLVSREKVFYVQHNNTILEQIKTIWEFFNVIMKQKDIFSRCLMCNGNSHVQVPGDDVKTLFKGHKVYPPMRMYGHMKVDIKTEIWENNEKLKKEILSKKNTSNAVMFYVCVGCGIINWKGTHHKKVIEKFRSLCVDGDLKTGDDLEYIPSVPIVNEI